jgi:hypothetical protein
MKPIEFSRLKRPRQPMPNFILKALRKRGLLRAYRRRPAYRQNDYLAWIDRAKRAETIDRRLAEMLEDLTRGTDTWGCPTMQSDSPCRRRPRRLHEPSSALGSTSDVHPSSPGKPG